MCLDIFPSLETVCKSWVKFSDSLNDQYIFHWAAETNWTYLFGEFKLN